MVAVVIAIQLLCDGMVVRPSLPRVWNQHRSVKFAEYKLLIVDTRSNDKNSKGKHINSHAYENNRF